MNASSDPKLPPNSENNKAPDAADEHHLTVLKITTTVLVLIVALKLIAIEAQSLIALIIELWQK